MVIQELLAVLKATLPQTDITLYPGANEQLIQQFEKEMKLVLPADFKTFYTFCNGFESAEDMFRIIPLEEIIERKAGYYFHQFTFAEYMIYGDLWEVEINNKTRNYHIFNMDTNSQKVMLTDSLAVFIYRFMQGGVYEKNGLISWPNEIRGRNSELEL